MKPLCVVAVLSLALAALAVVMEALGYEIAGGSYAVAAIMGLASLLGASLIGWHARSCRHAESMLTLKTELEQMHAEEATG